MNPSQICLVVAVVLFVIAGLVAEWPAGWPRISLGWFGLAFFAGSFLLR